MENKSIINIGKGMFGASFLLGNICLFGYIITKMFDFVIYGYLLLLGGTLVNLIVAGALLIYGCCNKKEMDSCIKSVRIILLNLPIAILYAIIGLKII